MNFVNVLEIKKKIYDYKCKRINFQMDLEENRTPDNPKQKNQTFGFLIVSE